ncbi:phosphoglycolate phosphatase [Gammaproteobacteria bacterium]
MTYQLLVFDWDGTLMDSITRIVACMRQAFGECGLPSPGNETIHQVIGLGLDEAIAALAPELQAATRQRIAQYYRRHYRAPEGIPTPLHEGADSVLSTLRGAGYHLAIATGKGRRGLDRALIHSGLDKYFDASRCADESPSKPHPAMLESLMLELHCPPQATLMIGDSEYDMQMAMHAGADALAVCHGVHDEFRLRGAGALDCLMNLRAIPGWLKQHIR